MKAIFLLRAQTSLSFRIGREKDQAGTLPYVPGTAVWGGLAAAHGLLRPSRRAEFAEFFLTERLRCGNLYPASFAHDALMDEIQPVCPLPRTARTCKRFPGFRFGAEEEDENRHGISDQLIPLALFALSDEQNTQPLDAVQYCSICDGDLDPAGGFYRRGLEPDEFGQPEVPKGIRTCAGINRATGTVQEGILYSREALRRGARFWGTLTVTDEALLEAFRDFAEDVASAGMIRIGNNRTRGFGRVVLQIRPGEEEGVEELAERAKAFDAMLREAASQASIETPHGFYLPLTLVSDAILYDRLLHYRLRLTGDYLGDTWSINGAELVYQNADRRLVSGWSNLWGLPKADEWPIAMGSVFLFGLPSEPDFSTLARMQSEGIGARRSEGFGQVRVAESFHQEVNPL